MERYPRYIYHLWYNKYGTIFRVDKLSYKLLLPHLVENGYKQINSFMRPFYEGTGEIKSRYMSTTRLKTPNNCYVHKEDKLPKLQIHPLIKIFVKGNFFGKIG